MKTVLAAIRDIFAGGIDQQCECASHLRKLCKAIDQANPELTVPRKSFPVVDRNLHNALSLASNANAKALARALANANDRLHWQLLDYGDFPEFQALKTNYAYALVAGPKRWSSSNFYCEDVFFGLSLQAPHTLYAEHAHKAAEIYYVVSGQSEWMRGEEKWTERSSGSFVFHSEHIVHAMRSLDEPLLSLFAWTSDLDDIEPNI